MPNPALKLWHDYRNFPGIQARQALGPDIPCVRAGTATFEDWENLVRTVAANESGFTGGRRVENLALESRDLDGTGWSDFLSGDGAVVHNADGSATVSTVSTGRVFVVRTLTFKKGHTYKVSVRFSDITIGGTPQRSILMTSADYTPASPGFTISTTEDQRAEATTFVADGPDVIGQIKFGLGINGDATGENSFTITDVQVEDVSGQADQSPSEYQPTTTAPAARFYATNKNGGPLATPIKGRRIHSARTELCLHNRDFTDAAWVKTTMTAAKDQVGEDGVANAASSLLATAANATALQSFTIASAVKVSYFSLKRLIGTGDVQITIDNGTTWTTVTINSSTFTRVFVTQTLANPVIGIRLVVDTDKVAVDYAGINDGAAFPTSRIETAGATVTRNADVPFTTDVNFYNPVRGIVYVDSSQPVDTGSNNVNFTLSDNSNSDRIHLTSRNDLSGGKFVAVRSADTTVVNLTSGDSYSPGSFKVAFGYKLNDFEHFVNGTRTDTGDQSGVVPTGISKLNVGSFWDDTVQHDGDIAEIRYYDLDPDLQFLEDLTNGLITEEDELTFVRNLVRPLVRDLVRPL